MSEVIRRLRIKTAPYRKGQLTMDGKYSPFRLLPASPGIRRGAEELPDIIIEGVPSLVPGDLRQEALERMKAKRNST